MVSNIAQYAKGWHMGPRGGRWLWRVSSPLKLGGTGLGEPRLPGLLLGEGQTQRAVSSTMFSISQVKGNKFTSDFPAEGWSGTKPTLIVSVFTGI